MGAYQQWAAGHCVTNQRCKQTGKLPETSRALNFVDIMWREGPYYAASCVPRPGSRMNSVNWDLMNSVFVERIKEADSRHFFDIPSVYSKAFKHDWRLCNGSAIITGRKSTAKQAYAHGKPGTPEPENPRVAAVRHVLKKQYKRLMDIFTYESAAGMHFSAGTAVLQTWSWGTYTSFIKKIQIHHPKYLNANDADIIFITCNVRVKTEHPGPDRFLCRYEFLQLLLRLAMRRFVWSKQVANITEGLERLIRDHVYRFCTDGGTPLTSLNRDLWRRDRFYTREVSSLFNANLSNLRRLYRVWSESMDETVSQQVGGHMSYQEYTAMVVATGLVQTTQKVAEQLPKAVQAKPRFGGKRKNLSHKKSVRSTKLREKRLAAKMKAREEAEDDAEENALGEVHHGRFVIKAQRLSEMHIRLSFINSQMWVKNVNSTIKHKRMTFTDFMEGLARMADSAYITSEVPKEGGGDGLGASDTEAGSDDEESGGEDEDQVDVPLHVKLDDFLTRCIMPLLASNKRPSPSGGHF